MSEEKYVLTDVSNDIDADDGCSKLELLYSLANELGYGVYSLHKEEGKQKELTVVTIDCKELRDIPTDLEIPK